MAGVILSLDKVSKTFKVGDQDVQVLKEVDLKVNEGDFTIILGPSGSGKSTILHTVLGLEPPSVGRVNFLGEDLYANSTEDSRSDIRKQHVGMVYQQANWIKSFNVKENVSFPLLLLGRDPEESYKKAVDLLGQVGLEEWAEYMPTELSSGQQQRVALARALINDPKMIVADEPTGNLDYENGQAMMQLLHDLNQKEGKTIIMVSHDLGYIGFGSTAVYVFDGRIDGVYQGDEKKKLVAKLHDKKEHTPGQIKKDAAEKEKKVEEITKDEASPT